MWIFLFIAFLVAVLDILAFFLKILSALCLGWALYQTFEGVWGETRAAKFQAQIEDWVRRLYQAIADL